MAVAAGAVAMIERPLVRSILSLGVILGMAAAQPQVAVVRTYSDHVEVDVGQGLELVSATCPARLLGATLSAVPKGFNPCVVELKAGDQTYRVWIGAQGESGFNVILGGNTQFGPAGAFTWGSALLLNGGWGDLHLNGELDYAAASPLDGRLRLRYQDTQLDWAGAAGLPGHPAGDTGTGLYAAQDLGMFTLAAATPLATPARVGLGLNTANVCFGGSMNIQAKDIILWASAGAPGFSIRAQYQPKRTTFLDFEGIYRDTPAFHLHFGGSEVAGYAEIWGLAGDLPFDWLKYYAKGSLSSTGFSSAGQLDSPQSHLEYTQDPTNGLYLNGYYSVPIGNTLTELRLGGQYLSAGPSYGQALSKWLWDANWGTDLGLRFGTLGLGGVLGLSYGDSVQGDYRVALGLEADGFGHGDSYRGTAEVILRGLEGWQFGLEAKAPFTQFGNTVIQLKASQWLFSPVDPPAADVHLMAADETVPQYEPSYCWRWR